MRLIDAEAYERELITVDGDEDTVYNAICALDKMPTVDTVKHGSWSISRTHFSCTQCGWRVYVDYEEIGCVQVPNWSYCPKCGSKMDGDTE